MHRVGIEIRIKSTEVSSNNSRRQFKRSIAVDVNNRNLQKLPL